MLDAAQKVLEQRFAALSAARKSLGHPVYAIEHGFNSAMVEQMREATSKELRTLGVLQRHWLVWAALTAEAGYRYRGDEYWPELEWHDGEWRNNANRAWVRQRFEKFRTAFGGPEPVGAWANHFNIIAWPIANAVLPRYLQPHFAEHLYDQRFAIVHAVPQGAEAIGTALVDEYRGNSTRFKIFLKQVDLTGQIVLALRDEDLGGKPARISPDVLARIVRDLEKRKDSREYLRSARKIISTRQAIVALRLRPAVGALTGGAGADTPIAPVRIAGRLDGSTVRLGLIFPDVSTALDRADLSPGALSKVRIRLAGATSQWEPGQTLLSYAKCDRVLDELPPAGTPVIALEGAEDALREALQPLLIVPERATRLLKRQSDGLFREVVGGQVRTGQSYLLLTRHPLEAGVMAGIGAKASRCSTAGVEAYVLDIGQRLSEAQRVELEKLGVGSVTGIRVDPVGLMPGVGDDGLPTWLTSEPVLLRLSADYDASGFTVSIDGGERSRVAATDGSAQLAFEALEVGRHRLDVQAVISAGAGTPTGATTGFELIVRQPEPWPRAMRGKSGFRLLVDPLGAELEPVLSGKASLSVLGPAGRTVRWALETFDAAGQVVKRGEGGNTCVGSNGEDIALVIDRLRRDLSDAIDVAHRVDIIATLGDLGRQSIAFAHPVEPLRWSFDPKVRVARLIDETDRHEPPKLATYSLSEPARGRPVEFSDALAGITIDAPGALMVAQQGKVCHAMFASVPQQSKVRALSDLVPQQSIRIAKPDAESILTLLRTYSRWSRARAFGPQAILRKEMTLLAIRRELVLRACGPEFAAALATGSPFQRAQLLVGGSPGFGARMRTFAHHEANAATLAALGACALAYRVVKDPAECEDAYALAFAPLGLASANGQDAIARVQRTLQNGPLIRGVFLAHAASASEPRVAKAMAG